MEILTLFIEIGSCEGAVTKELKRGKRIKSSPSKDYIITLKNIKKSTVDPLNVRLPAVTKLH